MSPLGSIVTREVNTLILFQRDDEEGADKDRKRDRWLESTVVGAICRVALEALIRIWEK
jgi:hypothetical protein